MSVYPWLRPLLFRLDAETAHRAVTALAAGAVGLPGGEAAARALFGYEHPALRTRLWGRDLANPLGLAAGFDKDATLLAPMAALGFGLLEVGTVTPRPQPGNTRPRLFRLPADRALVNRMGFNNGGAEALAGRLRAWRARHPAAVVGVNLGKNRDTPLEEAAADYLAALEAVHDVASYLVVNVSSPNTPGLRRLQDRDTLGAVVAALAAERDRRAGAGGPRVPLVVKLAPDLAEEALADAVDVALAAGCDGFIATNTTLARDGLRSPRRDEPGGLSGAPLRPRALAAVASLYRLCEGRVPLIGVGGIASAEEAYAFIRAGASAVQVYTGLVYEGPGLVRRIKRGLVRLLERDGLADVTRAVGADRRH